MLEGLTHGVWNLLCPTCHDFPDRFSGSKFNIDLMKCWTLCRHKLPSSGKCFFWKIHLPPATPMALTWSETKLLGPTLVAKTKAKIVWGFHHILPEKRVHVGTDDAADQFEPIKFLVGGLVDIFYFPIYWVANHPNWLSYFSEGWPNHQPDKFCLPFISLLPNRPLEFEDHQIPQRRYWFYIGISRNFWLQNCVSNCNGATFKKVQVNIISTFILRMPFLWVENFPKGHFRWLRSRKLWNPMGTACCWVNCNHVAATSPQWWLVGSGKSQAVECRTVQVSALCYILWYLNEDPEHITNF